MSFTLKDEMLESYQTGYDFYNTHEGVNNGRSTNKVFPVHCRVGEEINSRLASSTLRYDGYGTICWECHLEQTNNAKNAACLRCPRRPIHLDKCKKCGFTRRYKGCKCRKIKEIAGQTYIQGKEQKITESDNDIVCGSLSLDGAIVDTYNAGTVVAATEFKWPMRDLGKNHNNLVNNLCGQSRQITHTNILFGLHLSFLDKTPTGTGVDTISDEIIKPYIKMQEMGWIDSLAIEILSIDSGQIKYADKDYLNLSQGIKEKITNLKTDDFVEDLIRKCLG